LIREGGGVDDESNFIRAVDSDGHYFSAGSGDLSCCQSWTEINLLRNSGNPYAHADAYSIA
jgi:hypothetical protein